MGPGCTRLWVALLAGALLVGSSSTSSGHAGAIRVVDDIGLLDALRSGAEHILLTRPVKLGAAWSELELNSITLDRNVTLLGADPQLTLDLAFQTRRIQLNGAWLHLEGLHLTRFTFAALPLGGSARQPNPGTFRAHGGADGLHSGLHMRWNMGLVYGMRTRTEHRAPRTARAHTWRAHMRARRANHRRRTHAMWCTSQPTQAS